MLNLTKLAVDPVLASEGTWADYAGGRFLIARFNNPKAQELRSSLALKQMALLQSGTDEGEAAAQAINVEVLAHTILLAWEGVSEDGKTAVAYTPEVGVKYLADPRFAELKEFIQNFSFNRENYQEKVEAEVTKSVKTTAVS